MSTSVSTTQTAISRRRRWLLFGAAVGVGAIWGYVWSIDASLLAYSVLLGIFASENIEIASLAMGVGVGFVLGFVHIAAPCYLPAALAAMPLSQTVRNNREWLKTVAVLAVCMVAVTAVFGDCRRANQSVRRHHRQPQNYVPDHVSSPDRDWHHDDRYRHGRTRPDPPSAA